MFTPLSLMSTPPLFNNKIQLSQMKPLLQDIEANHQSLTQMLTVLGSIIKSDSDSIDSFREVMLA